MARILIIDDDDLFLNMLQKSLGDQGFEVISAADAGQGLMAARQQRPDLIVSDINLPDQTGFQLVSQIREDPGTKAIPVILMSGAARFPTQQAMGLKLGANE